MRQEAHELIAALGAMKVFDPPGAVILALRNLTDALSAPPAMRPTQIGHVSVDENGIDRLDAVLSATIGSLKNARAAEERLQAEVDASRAAVTFAAADLAHWNARRQEDPADGEIRTLWKARKRARKAYACADADSRLNGAGEALDAARTSTVRGEG